MFHFLVGDSIPGFKGLMVFFEVLTLWVLVLTLRAYGFEEARIFIYAWNPLVIFEIGYGGHVDGLTVFLTRPGVLPGRQKEEKSLPSPLWRFPVPPNCIRHSCSPRFSIAANESRGRSPSLFFFYFFISPFSPSVTRSWDFYPIILPVLMRASTWD